jgi:Family of unknown function (DUF6843)
MRRLLAVLVSLVGGGVGLAAILLGIGYLSGALGRPVRYEIPAGYLGWVVVRYEVPTCTPLKREGVYVVVPISKSGTGCTSDAVLRGWRYTRYDYVLRDGARIRIPTGRGTREPAVLPVSYSSEKAREVLFVGTQRQFEAHPWPSE